MGSQPANMPAHGASPVVASGSARLRAVVDWSQQPEDREEFEGRPGWPTRQELRQYADMHKLKFDKKSHHLTLVIKQEKTKNYRVYRYQKIVRNRKTMKNIWHLRESSKIGRT